MLSLDQCPNCGGYYCLVSTFRHAPDYVDAEEAERYESEPENQGIECTHCGWSSLDE